MVSPAKIPFNMWAFDETKISREIGAGGYSKGLVTLTAYEILPLRSDDSITFNWNWRGDAARCTCDAKAKSAICECSNPDQKPSSLLYSFTLVRLASLAGDAMAIACFDRHVTNRSQYVQWRPRRAPYLPLTPFVVGVEEDGALRIPSSGNYLVIGRVAVGIERGNGAAGEQLALQARTVDAGSAGWVDLCCFGRDHSGWCNDKYNFSLEV